MIKIGDLPITKMYLGADEVTKIFLGNDEIYSNYVPGPGPAVVVDPILENNDWSTIKEVCEAGDAANYWAVGDTKTDTGADGYTRTFRIVDMTGLYGKHVVFEQVNIEGTDGSGTSGVAWNSISNTDASSAYNNWEISDIRTTILQDVINNRISRELAGELTVTNIQIAKNGIDGVLVTTSDKLFLAAEKEVGYTGYSLAAEQNALSIYSYYSIHSSSADHTKYNSSNSARAWWLRSPNANGGSDGVCLVSSWGGNSSNGAQYSSYFTPCFSF